MFAITAVKIILYNGTQCVNVVRRLYRDPPETRGPVRISSRSSVIFNLH